MDSAARVGGYLRSHWKQMVIVGVFAYALAHGVPAGDAAKKAQAIVGALVGALGVEAPSE